jgi:hypothetical protein
MSDYANGWHQDETLLTRLEILPQLPKPGPTISIPNNAFKREYGARCISEIFRICRSGVVYAHADKEFRDGVFKAMEIAHVDDLAVYLKHPWQMQKPADGDLLEGWAGTWGSEIEQMADALKVIENECESHGKTVRYVISGQEECNVTDENRGNHARFHNAIYDTIKRTCPAAHIVYYSRLNRKPSVGGDDGWSIRPLYSGDEKGPFLCCDCYWPDWVITREQVRKMTDLIKKRRRHEMLVPWTCLGRGYAPKPITEGIQNEGWSFSLTMTRPAHQFYIGRMINWENQAWVDYNDGMPLFQRDVASELETSRMYAANIPFQVIWPGPFDHRYHHEYWVSDFEAYVKGANGWKEGVEPVDYEFVIQDLEEGGKAEVQVVFRDKLFMTQQFPTSEKAHQWVADFTLELQLRGAVM